MKRLFSILKNELVTGLVLIAPVAGAAWLMYWMVTLVDGWFPAPLRDRLPLPGIGLAVVLGFALVVGFLAHNLVGQRIVTLFESAAQRIPLFGTTYGLIKQVMGAVFSTGGGSFNRAVLVSYPTEGSWAIGFVTQEHIFGALQEATGADLISVYVPTTPNPTSGFYLLVERDRVRELAMPVDQAFKLVLTMGIADAEGQLSTTAKWSRPEPG